jgi:hypothetical protein
MKLASLSKLPSASAIADAKLAAFRGVVWGLLSSLDIGD